LVLLKKREEVRLRDANVREWDCENSENPDFG
jgi:hypothetical protein